MYFTFSLFLSSISFCSCLISVRAISISLPRKEPLVLYEMLKTLCTYNGKVFYYLQSPEEIVSYFWKCLSLFYSYHGRKCRWICCQDYSPVCTPLLVYYSTPLSRTLRSVLEFYPCEPCLLGYRDSSGLPEIRKYSKFWKK